MPVFRNGSLVVYSLHVGEVCTTNAIDPPCYALPPDLPPGVRVRLLAFEAGWWRVERADQPGGPTWSVYQILLEPDPVRCLAARLDRERRRGRALEDMCGRYPLAGCASHIGKAPGVRVDSPRAWANRIAVVVGSLLLILTGPLSAVAQPITELRVDFAQTNGAIRPLHGLNKGPLAAGGLIDLTASLRDLAVPSTRLHDCHWPNPDVVDIHAVFPDFRADPSHAGNYDFALTDEYVTAIRQTGAGIIYRLGESIEHTTKKRFVHPPTDPAHWAEICLGVIRHYNEGWADGFRHDIRYWEIWNEPENRPAMWSGTDEEYFQLYRVAARAIKQRHPELKVGGPAVGASGQFVDGVFRPTAFVTNFLTRCRRDSVPLDFFSWHCYTADPTEPGRRARAIRQLLDAYGFPATESHLNEWNYLPGDSWSPLARTARPEARQRHYGEMAGAPGAAFITAALLDLQDAPVDVCNLFHGELGGFGLFNEHGVPQKNYHALRAFRELLRAPQRVGVRRGGTGKLSAVAGLNPAHTEAAILVANLVTDPTEISVEAVRLPWSDRTTVETHLVDRDHDFAPVCHATNAANSLKVSLPGNGPAVVLLRLRPAAP